MKQPGKKLWIGITFLLSIVVIVFGYPAFHTKYGFPRSLFWTLACLVGVWVTYQIRAFFWRDRENR